MEIQNRYKPLLFIGVGIAILSVFFWFVTRPTPLNKAIAELQLAIDYNKTKEVWNGHKSNNFANKSEWINAVQSHLSNMSLTSEQQTDLSIWFPVKTYVNVVVLPDLSGRLITDPHPTDNDKVVIDYIWQAFRELVRKSYTLNGQNTRDRLMIDMTRERELQMQSLASRLIVDCSKTQQSSIPYLTGVEDSFRQAIGEIYTIGGQQTQGADYFKYINESLNDRWADSSPFVKYRNLVVILTDGYLETTKGPIVYYTGSPNQLFNLRNGRQAKKTWDQLLPAQHLLIREHAISAPKLNGWEVLILQVRDRKDGDFEILEKLWNDWLVDLGAKWTPGVSFQKYQIAPINNKNAIAKFFNVESSKLTSPLLPIPINTPQEGDNDTSTNTAKLREYEELLAEADQAIDGEDFKKGKLLFQKAVQLRKTANLPISPKAEAVYDKYVRFADKAYQTFIETKTDGLQDIPARYYELAGIIKPSAAIERKLAACTNP